MADEERLNIGGVTVTVAETGSEDRKEIGTLADRFRETHSKAVMVLFSSAGRGAIHTAVTDDLITDGKHAGELVKRNAEVSGGKGGGRPTFASAGAGEAGRSLAARQSPPSPAPEAAHAEHMCRPNAYPCLRHSLSVTRIGLLLSALPPSMGPGI